MSSSQQVGTRSKFDLGVALVEPKAPPQPPVPVEPPPPPRVPITQQIKESYERWKHTPVGEGITNWVNTVGAVAGYVVPAAVLAGAGYAVGHLSGLYDGTLTFMQLAGGAGAVASVLAQGKDTLGNVALYKREGHPHPRLASFRDVMIYFALPAVATGVAVEMNYGGVSGLWAGGVAGAIGATIGLSVFNARKRRVR